MSHPLDSWYAIVEYVNSLTGGDFMTLEETETLGELVREYADLFGGGGFSPPRLPEPPPVRTSIPTGTEVPSKNQLELIDLGKFSPVEARMIATALQKQAMHFAEDSTKMPPDGWSATTNFNIASNYNALRRKVEFRAGVSLVP
jgi:hypothetical protein